MKKTILAAVAMAAVFFMALIPSLGLAEITVKRDHNGEIQSVSTNTKGIGAKIESQYRKEGHRSYLVQRGGSFEIKIDLSKVAGKKKDYYTLLFTYSVGRGADLAHDTGKNPYGRNFLAEGIKVEIFLDGETIELTELEQRGHGSGLWFVKFRITEKELAAIVDAAKMDFKASNKRNQSIAWHIKENDLDELKEFCAKYAGVKTEASPSLKRDEPVKIVGQPGENASPVKKEKPENSTSAEKSEETTEGLKEKTEGLKEKIDKINDIKKKIPKLPFGK